MIKSHEQQMDVRLPRIGVIRKGAPKPERGPGRDLDHFRLDRAEPSVVAAWLEAFGPEPKSISGILPYADPAENLNIWDELWQGKRLLWRGDGERLHVQLQGSNYVRFAPGSGPAQPAAAGATVGKGKVARISRLRLLLPQLRIAGIFDIMSSSAIDADELWANLMWIRSTVPTLQGAPVTIFRAERQFNVAQPDGKVMVVKKYMLHMMLDGRYLDALLPAPTAGLLAPVVAPPAQPAAGNQSDVAGDDDAPDEGEWEEDAPPVQQPPVKPAPPADSRPPTPLDLFVERAAEQPGVQAVAFANGRLTAWVNFVTDNTYDPARDELLLGVLDAYCSAVADNDNTHTKAAAEKARQSYQDKIAPQAKQDDLFGEGQVEEPPAKFQDPA